jgi:hypothetical protein
MVLEGSPMNGPQSKQYDSRTIGFRQNAGEQDISFISPLSGETLSRLCLWETQRRSSRMRMP